MKVLTVNYESPRGGFFQNSEIAPMRVFFLLPKAPRILFKLEIVDR